MLNTYFNEGGIAVKVIGILLKFNVPRFLLRVGADHISN